ncbi:MAG: hypothetical protein ACTSYD_10740 [Candidatus Heimdallarchaeaceae archaeon]
MKKNKAKKKLIRAYSIIALMVLSTLAWNVVNGAGHGVTIAKPVNNSVYNNLYNKARVTTEKTALTFDFTIDNHDGYLIKYDAWIDGVADPKLNDPNWDPSLVLAHYVIPYDAQQFLDNYGQGAHTFTVAIYHGTPYVRPPFGLQEGDNPDDDDIYWVGNQGYLLSLVDEVSVTFTFDPVVVHYAGFWFEGVWRNKDNSSLVHQSFSNNMFAFHDLLWSPNAHYLHGYSFLSGSWDRTIIKKTFKKLSNNDDTNDIDFIHFATHGAGISLNKTYGIPLGALKLPDKIEIKSLNEWYLRIIFDVVWYGKKQLQYDLRYTKFHSTKIFLVLSSCYSGYFIDIHSNVGTLSHLNILAACKPTEKSMGFNKNEYQSSWALETKLSKMSHDFSRALAQALCFGYDLETAWEKLRSFDYSLPYSYYGSIYDGVQHPTRSIFTFD